MLMANLMSMISTRLQLLLIGKMFDARALGYYSLAQNTQMAPAQFIGSVLNRVGLPVFSNVADQPAKMLGALRLSLRVAMFAFVPCMAGLAVMARPVISVIYGPGWETAAPLLSLLSLAALFWPLHVLNLAAISACGWSNLIFRLEVIKSAVSIALIVVASFISVTTVAWAVLASSLISVCINTWYSHTLLDYGMLRQLRDQSATLMLSAAAAAIAWLVSRWLHPASLKLAAAAIAAAAFYFGMAALLRITAWHELLAVMHAWRSRDPALTESQP